MFLPVSDVNRVQSKHLIPINSKQFKIIGTAGIKNISKFLKNVLHRCCASDKNIIYYSADEVASCRYNITIMVCDSEPVEIDRREIVKHMIVIR